MRKLIKNILYLIPFIYFCFGTIIWTVSLINSLSEADIDLVYYILNWGSIININLLTTHSIFLFHIISCPWTFLILYLQKINTIKFLNINKAISLYLLFLLNLIIITWFAGVSSYRSFSFVIFTLIAIWGYLGLFSSIIAILFSKLPSIRSKMSFIFEKVDLLKVNSFLKKYESKGLILIQFIIGISLSVSDIFIPTRIHGSYTFIPSIMIIILTIIAIDLLYLFNFLLTMKEEHYISSIEEQKEYYRKKSLIILEKVGRIIENKIRRSSKRTFTKVITKLEELINYFDQDKTIIETEEDQFLVQQLNRSLINVYNKRAEIYELNGSKFYQKNSFHQTQNEWNAAINDYKYCLKLIKSKNFTNSLKKYENKILNLEQKFNPLKIEILILETDHKLKELKNDRSLLKSNLTKAIELVNNLILSYSEAKEKADLSDELKDIQKKLESRIQNAQIFRSHLQKKIDESIGLKQIPTILDERIRDGILSVIREYEFIGGQIRFKVGIINNTNYTFTNLRLAFNLPEALKWIIHEPKYERKGDSILISKLGAHEKQAVSLYLEPINCMESSVNVTVSFFDAKEKPHAVPMKPKMIAISCPIFFTEDEANLARVKSLRRSLANRDKKVFPIANPEKGNSIFSSILSVLGKFDIKLVYKEFDDEINYGEAWFYGITKVKKNRIIPHVTLDTENKVLEFEVAGDDAEQITSFLAEVGDRVRKTLIRDNVIKPEEKFFDMRITVMSNFCPYCYTLISDELVQRFLKGESINCKNCLAIINLDEK